MIASAVATRLAPNETATVAAEEIGRRNSCTIAPTSALRTPVSRITRRLTARAATVSATSHVRPTTMTVPAAPTITRTGSGVARSDGTVSSLYIVP